MLEEKVPFIGAPRDAASCPRTVEVITAKLWRLGLPNAGGGRLLDVGCGDGLFTLVLGKHFREVHGIDVQEPFLARFREVVKNDARFTVSNVSAAAMPFSDSFFDTIVTIETLEHVEDLPKAATEIVRVLRPGGELFLTVPNRWFPFENHGVQIGAWRSGGRVPLVTYWPWLHRRIALARVFTVRALDRLFVPAGLTKTAVDYAWPTFEHDGNPFQKHLRPLFGLMRKLEDSPLRMFGSSVVVRYTKRNERTASVPAIPGYFAGCL